MSLAATSLNKPNKLNELGIPLLPRRQSLRSPGLARHRQTHPGDILVTMNRQRNISYLLWTLPRPSNSSFPGSFPLHFEKKLIKLLAFSNTPRVLHSFGGSAQFGIKIDINPENQPTIIATAEALPFKDNTFDLVIGDPPFSAALARKLYGCRYPHFKKWTREAVRTCKPQSFICLYHTILLPRLPGTQILIRIVVVGRPYSTARIATVLRKDSIFSSDFSDTTY